jgi:hypothetical protein
MPTNLRAAREGAVRGKKCASDEVGERKRELVT